jgi:hypothetical protein
VPRLGNPQALQERKKKKKKQKKKKLVFDFNVTR